MTRTRLPEGDFDPAEDGRRNYDHAIRSKRHELLRSGKAIPINDEERAILDAAAEIIVTTGREGKSA